MAARRGPENEQGECGAPRERAGGPRLEGRRWAGWGREGFRCRGISSPPLRPATRCLPAVWSMGHPRPSHRTCGHHRWLCLSSAFFSHLPFLPWAARRGTDPLALLHLCPCMLPRVSVHSRGGWAIVPLGWGPRFTPPGPSCWVPSIHTRGGPLPTFWFSQWHCGGTPRSAELTLSCF